MATPRRRATPVKEPDCLLDTKTNFSEKLSERIAEGKDFLKANFASQDILNDSYNKYNRWDQWNTEFLKQSFNNEYNEYRKRYERLNDFVGSSFFSDRSYTGVELHTMHISNKIEFLERLLSQVDLLKSSVKEVSTGDTLSNVHKEYNNCVFIVHGHNQTVLHNVARTLEKLSMNPIILSEQPNGGKTIIEKFEANADVGFVVVLLTDDDLGKAKTDANLNHRARQNVILELGYFMGRLGRDRVMPLYISGVELPSDIHGLLYTEIDTANKWKFEIVKELKQAGYSVDANLIL